METHVKTLLHAGCGTGKLPYGYQTFRETRLDCDAMVRPDVLSSIVAMPMLKDETFDRVFASHVVEHLYSHEVGMALAEFHRVLKPGGILEVFVPDLQAIGGKIALDQLDMPAYLCSMGPITALDMLYGHRASIAKGELAMVHRTGFTGSVLKAALQRAGFEKVVLDRDGGSLELKGTAIKAEVADASSEPGAESVPEHALRTRMGEEARVRQPGQVAVACRQEAGPEKEEEVSG